MDDRAARVRAAVVAGHQGRSADARRLRDDPDDRVRAAAVGALARTGHLTDADVAGALDDPSPRVRRRAVEAAIDHPTIGLTPLLEDPDPSVVEVAAWALGERPAGDPAVIDALASTASSHAEPLCREAAVASLGALGDERGLAAILEACTDRATVRRRAVLALAPFDGAAVDAALEVALGDRDWQVRQAAEDLLAARTGD